MFQRSAVFDTTVFNYLARMYTPAFDFSLILSTLLPGGVFMPETVAKELQVFSNDLKYQKKILNWINDAQENKFFKYCTDRDHVTHDFLKKILDAGEADAMSQCIQKQSSWFITDDHEAVKKIKKYNFNVVPTYSTFYLIALADVNGLLPNYYEICKSYYQIIGFENFGVPKRKLHLQRIRAEYTAALKCMSFKIDKKVISKKTNIKYL